MFLLLRAATQLPLDLRGNTEAEPLLPQRGWISLQNTTVGYTDYYNQRQVQPWELRLGLEN
jgi:hypothetical protein